MKNQLLFLLLIISYMSFGQNVWTETSPEKLTSSIKMDRASFPKAYKLFSLEFENLKAVLKLSPNENSGILSTIICSFPDSNGNLKSFKMYESSTLSPELAAKFKDIKTYVGQGIEDPTASINISSTLFGLHAQILSGNKPTVLIDTYTKDNKNYIVYDKNSLSTSPRGTYCGVTTDDEAVSNIKKNDLRSSLANDSKFRTYRLAVANTIEYAAYHINAAGLGSGTLAQQKAAVLAAIAVTIVRVNGVYRREMSLQLQLVSNNDLLINITTDNFSNDTPDALINESQTEIDSIIGDANYDIGHTVSTGGGGLAQKPSVCVSGKARGITGSPAPVGDSYDIDFVAHEIGHQFGCDHTFAGDSGNCTGNRSVAFAVEPGSGTTIMAYAGICAPQNVQPNSNDYFSVVSLAQMFSHITGAGNCQAGVSSGNTPPVIPLLTNYTIPKGTPFQLIAPLATDVDGDVLTYCWEQTNPFVSTTSSPIGASTSTTGAIFRSYSPTTALNRYIPKFSEVLANNLFPNYEKLPTVARSLSFALTVRDNQTPNGGQTARANMTVTVSNAGPFDVTSQATDGISWTQGSSQTITWTVNGTTSLVGSTNVDILLSTDSGLTFPTVLAGAVPNNGSAVIIVPNVISQNCRILVKPTGNIFYDVNKKIFAIGYVCNTSNASPNSAIADGTGANVAGAATVETINFTSSVAISNMKVSVSTDHTWIGDLRLIVKNPAGTPVTLWSRICNNPQSSGLNVTFQDGAPAPTCASPTTGLIRASSSVGNPPVVTVNSLSVFNGTSSSGNWTLTATDNYNGDTGNILAWGIDFGCSLGSSTFSVDDYVLFPNPNNGSFNLKFKSDSSETKITIFDIRGRRIFNKTYQNNGLFDQNLQIGGALAGVYLINIQDGDRVVIKKIVIE